MKIQIRKKRFVFILLFASLVFIQSCKNDSNSTPVEPLTNVRGKLIGSAPLGAYPKSILLSYILSALGNQQISFSLSYDVDAYKIIYKTIDPGGNIVEASGLICIPRGKNNLSLISVQHGTQTNRNITGSVNPYNTPEGLIAASIGYFTLMPDYLGLGESNLIHPYHLAKPSADVVIDMIRAGREFASKNGLVLNGQVFLAGYSEGGYVTLAAHKEIQQNYSSEFKITACSPMAGAYDINLTAKKIIQNKIYTQPAYLAFFFVAYNYYYNWNRLNDIFNSPYLERIPSLFDGTKTTGEINLQLTSDINQLFKTSFVNSYLNGTETTITSAFENNSLLNWTPTAPIRFYHGDADEYVPYENSVNARNNFLSRGANVELITISGGTHLTSALPSIIGAVNWFEELRMKKVLAIK